MNELQEKERTVCSAGGARTSYPPKLKARALVALLLGNTPGYVAEDLGIPKETVRTWRRRLRSGEMELHLEPQKKGAPGDQFIAYLEQALRTLTVQSVHLADPDRLRTLNAEEAGILHGIMADKTIRILELIPATGPRNPMGQTKPLESTESRRTHAR